MVWLTVTQTAEELGISRRRVYVLIAEGKLSAYRLFGRGMRVLVEDLRDFIMARKVQPAPKADPDNVHRTRPGGSRH
jgi:excisionase family DNA binding protein